MEKVAILICERVKGLCTMGGCFRAIENKEEYFSRYEDPKLQSVMVCNVCCDDFNKENIEKMKDRLIASDVKSIHLGVCAAKCPLNKVEEIKSIFKKDGIEIILGTHKMHS